MRSRRGFTLLEVMIATGILVVSLVVLVQTQSTAAQMTVEADRIIVATQLCQEKMAEVRMLVEREGFTDAEITEDGDFDDFGDEAVNLEFEGLDDFHFEYLITPVDLELAGDLSSAAGGLLGAMGAPAGDAAAAAAQIPDMSSFGLSPEAITDALDPFIRELRVRVWWGEDFEEAERLGNLVEMTTHVINPAPDVLGRMQQGGGLPGGGGVPGGGIPGAGGGGQSPFGSPTPGAWGGGGRPGGGARPGGARGPSGGRPPVFNAPRGGGR